MQPTAIMQSDFDYKKKDFYEPIEYTTSPNTVK